MSNLIFAFILVLNSELLNAQIQANPTNPTPQQPKAELKKELDQLKLLSFPYARHLARIEEDLFRYMSAYEDILKTRLAVVSSYVKDYRESSLRGTVHIDHHKDPLARATAVASHPLMYYRLIKRYSNEVMALKTDLSRYVEADLTQKILGLTGQVAWPTMVEEEEATLALLRLHYIYDVDLKEFSNGEIGGFQTPVELTAKQSFNMAKYASYANFHTLAFDWLSATAVKTANATDQTDKIDTNMISTAYQDVISKHNRHMYETNNTGSMFTFTKNITGTNLPPRKRNVDKKIFYKTKPLNSSQYLQRPELEILERAQLDFLTLCSGKLLQNKAVKSQLHCYYDNKRHPYWLINPLKTEVLNFEPRLVQTYDFIGDTALDFLIFRALEYSQTPVDLTHYLAPGNVVYAWLNDTDYQEVKLSRKIELYTGLHVTGTRASAPLQMATHTVGSHEPLHVDFVDNLAASKGNRAASFILYLNNVDNGGYTAFPILGTFVRPVRGSAIFWHSTYQNGNVDPRMIHGICPPLMGHQWLARKWIYQHENMLRLPCNLNPKV